ncbi:MAG: DNA-binding response regulator [Candidatus Ozemobacter sibiricus]|jgi:DNA-binding response OmpR family regulator|uniref:DNA-binding response regulator n=1 Tax=Candidatus Ozemobacter sibiricus TaxID=2268124 RepID=A0A367ZUD3_9BACT|nr:MAG: DNA-binding response regulator [Candidatus Ozemobacter sibiricus]
MAKILLVDDDKDFVDINRAHLEKHGYTVVAGHNPQEGMALLHKEKPDLLILDVMMEEADDGFAMAQKIRKEGNKIPIIMLTSVAKITGQSYGKDSAMVPVNEFFEKPVPADKLLAAIKKYVK